MRPACGAAAISAAISGPASRCCNCEAPDALSGTSRTSQATPRGSAGGGRGLAAAGRGAAAGKGDGREPAGAQPGVEGGEAGAQAAQPRADQDDQRPGEPPAGDPRRDHPAQQVDDAGEVRGRGDGG